jgi:hypothetical protein
LLSEEERVLYREKWYAEIYEDHVRDTVLRRPSKFGSWLVVGLGVVLMAFLGYLVCTNVLFAAAGGQSSERLRHPLAQPEPATIPGMLPARIKAPSTRRVLRTNIPQSRATNALLGGEGPALPLEMIHGIPHQAFDAHRKVTH